MLAAELDAEERAERQAKAEAWQQARKDMEALDAQIHAWWNASNTLIDAYLTAHGYYRHERGPWRKRADAAQLRKLIDQANKGNRQAFDRLCRSYGHADWLGTVPGIWPYTRRGPAHRVPVQERALLTQEAQRRKCTALTRDLRAGARALRNVAGRPHCAVLAASALA